MNRRIWLAASTLLLAMPAIAGTTNGVFALNFHLLSGPAMGYPMLARVPAGSRIAILGCTNDWAWCDVRLNADRGWVPGNYTHCDYQGRQVPVRDYGARAGIPVVSFDLGAYWDSNYRSQPFYSQRDALYQQWKDNPYRDLPQIPREVVLPNIEPPRPPVPAWANTASPPAAPVPPAAPYGQVNAAQPPSVHAPTTAVRPMLAAKAAAGLNPGPGRVAPAPPGHDEGMPSGWLSDVYLPAKPQVGDAAQQSQTELHSNDSAEVLVKAFDRILTAAGWTGNFDPPGSRETDGHYVSKGTDIHLKLTPQSDHSVKIELDTDNGRLAASDRFLQFGQWPAGVRPPASALRYGPQHQMENLIIDSSDEPQSLIDTYKQKMAASGWTLNQFDRTHNNGVALHFVKSQADGEREVWVNLSTMRNTGTLLTIQAQQSHSVSLLDVVGSQRRAGEAPVGGTVALPPGLPHDMHLPASGVPQHVLSIATTNLRLPMSPDALFAQYEVSMKAAGWSEASETQNEFEKELMFRKQGRSAQVQMHSNAQIPGSVLRLFVQCTSFEGADTGACVEHPRDLFVPKSAVPLDFEKWEIHVDWLTREDPATLFDEYKRTMGAAGWQKVGENRKDRNYGLTFRNGAQNLEVSLMPDQDGATQLGLSYSRTDRVPQESLPHTMIR
jgi:uncharacterized protein YraI